MAKKMADSTPVLEGKKYLTSDHANDEFKKAYEERRSNYNHKIESYKKRLTEIHDQLKKLDVQERAELDKMAQAGGGKAGTTAPPAKPTTSNDPKQPTKPAPTPAAPPKDDPKAKPGATDKPKNPDPKPADGKADKTDPKKADPKPDPKKTDPKPDTSKTAKRPKTKDHSKDPLININKPVLDPKMEVIMPIYQERRRLKNEEARIKEKLKEIHTKKVSVIEKEKELQLRQNILKSINISPEFLKARKDANKSMTSIQTAASKTTASSVNIKKLKQIKRGFYLDILEGPAQHKTAFNNREKRYDVDHIVKVQKEHQKELKLKYSQAHLKAKTLAAMKDPTDPENSKFLKESAYYQMNYSAQSQRSQSPKPKQAADPKQGNTQQGGGTNKPPAGKDDKPKTTQQDPKKPDPKGNDKPADKGTDKAANKGTDKPAPGAKPKPDAKKNDDDDGGDF